MMIALFRLRSVRRVFFFAVAMIVCVFSGHRPLHGQANNDAAVAESLSTFLQTARTIVSRHQTEINNPDVGDKGLTGAKVLAETVSVYKNSLGVDPSNVDPSTRQGRLLR